MTADAITRTVVILGCAVLIQTLVAIVICSDNTERTPVYTNRGTLALSAMVPAIVCTVTYVNVYERWFDRGRMWFYVCMTLVHWHMFYITLKEQMYRKEDLYKLYTKLPAAVRSVEEKAAIKDQLDVYYTKYGSIQFYTMICSMVAWVVWLHCIQPST